MGTWQVVGGRINVSRYLRQYSKVSTALTLGAWLFALFVGIANACGWDDSDPASTSAVVATTSEKPSHDGSPVGCEQFCKTDVPVVSKAPTIGDQPDLQPLIVTGSTVNVVIPLTPAFRLARAAHPPPDVPSFLRFAHLRL